VKESTINLNKVFMPYQQAAIITKPGKGSFNFPSVAFLKVE
jgi:hypothetical protein